MNAGTSIARVSARQIYSGRGHPGVRATVTAANGATASVDVTAGTSVGKYEVQFAYDEDTRFGGRGVGRAIHNIEQVIAPALIGKDATRQAEIDATMLALDGTPDKRNLGGNALAAVSAAVLQAAARAVGLPLYQYIGGLNACLMPTPGVLAITGARRYGGGERAGSKPTYSFFCHGFDTFREASYAAWEVEQAFYALVWSRLKLDTVSRRQNTPVISPGYVQHDRELWALMVEAIGQAGYEGRIGIQVDVAAGTYYDEAQGRYIGLFSAEPKTREEMIELYTEAVRDYPFLIIEDPLDEDDFEGHALLTKKLGIEIVGDDLFTTNLERVRRGVELGAANTVLLKVNQIGTISEAFDMVQYAYRHGYGVMPCNSRGEGEVIADYTVGLGCGHLREGATGPVGDRLIEIEEELGSRAVFAGRAGLKP